MEKLRQLAEWLQKRGIDLYFVGGYVRDKLLGLPVEDHDICLVGGVTAALTQGYLELFRGRLIDNITSVHGDFPIWIVQIDGVEYQFAMARTERKVGQSHQDFLTEVRNVSIEQDLLRRDLTINAMAEHVLTGVLVDPYHGRESLEKRIAHPVSEAFAEDPLRVYRAARFIARFSLEPSQQLLQACKRLGGMTIPGERVGMELMKVLKTAPRPSRFFHFLNEVGWLYYHFPELAECRGVPQGKRYHPEGDVFTHTLYCMDAAHDWFTRAVMLCHDLGKAVTTTIDGVPFSTTYNLGDMDIFPETKVSAKGHEEAGVELTRRMLQRISLCDHATIRKIACLVELHMVRAVINYKNYDKIVRRTLRRLLHYGLEYPQLVEVVRCDLSGRPPLPAPHYYSVCRELYCIHALALVERGEMTPIVTGEKLLALGLEQGPELGVIIRHALELQDRGTLNKDNWLKVLKGAGHDLLKNIEHGPETANS